jgi:hypothetical protein
MLALDAFRRRYLDVRFRTRQGARARLIERPGLWMNEAELRAIVDDIKRVMVAGVGAGGLDYGVVSDPDTLKRAIITMIYDEDDGRAVAFNALHILDVEVHGRQEEALHLGLVMIDPAYRNAGLTGALYGITCFLLCARRQMRSFWITNVTQVPLIFGIVGDFVEDVYPTMRPGARRSFAHLQIARQLTTKYRRIYGVGPEAEFDEERFVLRNAYTGGSDNLKKTFDDAPKYFNDAANAMCKRELDYARGDDFVQVGRFSFSVARRYLTRSSDLISPFALLTHSVMLLGESVFAPIMQWLTPDQAMGSLRPAVPAPGQDSAER